MNADRDFYLQMKDKINNVDKEKIQKQMDILNKDIK